MITVAPAFAQVDSRTSDGIAHAGDCSHGYGPRCNQPRTVLKTPTEPAS